MPGVSIPLGRAALFLDLDGTLAEIAERPDDVGPDPRRTALVARAQAALDGRVAVVSGRAVADLARLIPVDGLSLAGSHGLERRTSDGGRLSAEPHPALPSAAAAFAALAANDAGLVLEEKPLSVALHYRGAPSAEAEVLALAERLAADTGLYLQRGRMVAELKTPGANKGDAIAAFIAEPPFAGASPLFLGDDLTDEPGFVVARELGGAGVLVGETRPTAALARLPSVGDTLTWIEASLDAGVFRLEPLA